MSDSTVNIARHLDLQAAAQPDRAALKIPRGRTRDGRIDYLCLTFAELSAEVEAWRARLETAGVRRHDRVLVMVRQGLPLIAAVFALFRLGAVPVVIDPGMGLKSFLACVKRTRPRALLGIPAARLISRLFRPTFASVEIRVPASGNPTTRLSFPQVSSLSPQVSALRPPPSVPSAPTAADDLAAILFTSGSTGSPKGVRYTHGMFAAQIDLIRSAYDIRPGEIDLPMLPVFALFNPALGMTTIVPEIDPSRPAAVDPAKIVQAILQENVTNSFGSPTLWGKIAVHCHHHKLQLPSLRRVLCAGAPVPPWLWQSSLDFLPHGTLHSPYGATEALPVSTISAPEVVHDTALRTLEGAGTCVGRPLPQNEVRIIPITREPIASLDQFPSLPPGEIGEIIVRGPTVTTAYDALPEATAAAKIPAIASTPLAFETLESGISTPTGAVWHRMGDAGTLDADGRLWFCGRIAERVETQNAILYPAQIEPLFAIHADIRRCALIGLGERGRQRPALVVEPTDPAVARTGIDRRRFARELREIARRSPLSADIKLFYFHPRLPVDVRHNAKIHRLTLARWAREKGVGIESDPKR